MTSSNNKTKKLSGHEQVVEFLNNLEHPLKNEIEEVRKIILSVNDNITEHIKWNAPSFCFNNEDRVTFNLQGKGFIRLILHMGAKVKNKKKKLPEDTTGLLEWVADDRAIIKLTDMMDVELKKERLIQAIDLWILANEE